MISPERIAKLRSMLARLPSRMDKEVMWHAASGLLDEIERLRAVIRETHSRCIEGRLCERTCKLYEIEP